MDMRTRQEMKLWALKSNIKHTALKELFAIWNRRIPNMFPGDPRTFLDTPRKIEITKIGDGAYWHNGLAQNLSRALNSVHHDSSRELTCLSLNFNMDGLPVYKSSKIEFWPILCNIHELPKIKPLVVGIYCGAGKPVDLALYLGPFVQEMQQILKHGLFIQKYGYHIQIKIRCFICDSPARAFIKGIVNFNGKNGCNKCTVIGEYSYISHCVYFPRIGCEKRNDAEFRALAYGSHHKCYTPLVELPINMIEDFPVGDSLHLIDLGVMKCCLMGWKDGNMGTYRTKWSYSNISTVSTFLVNCKMPSEIHRAVRGLDVLAFWKGTEYRTFLLYLSIVILRRVLPIDVYQHFLLFFCSVTICSSLNAHSKLLPVAETLLYTYIETYRDFYGEDFMTSNVHNLSHLIEEVRKFGELSTFSAYPFENRLFQIKRLLRNGNNPLSQVAKRIVEIMQMDNNTSDNTPSSDIEKYPILQQLIQSGHFSKIQFENFSLKSNEHNKWFLSEDEKIVAMKYAKKENYSIIIAGYALKDKSDVFVIPFRSSFLDIYKSNATCFEKNLLTFKSSDVKIKLVAIEESENIKVFIPLLHSYIQ
ncbi:uncharacterized protein LOC123306687 [Coccinella septempunctata]|uniref:uncharacterized protein LOC123306687 n=1 Tax=Coccinella septempunctata TaxID=41139 RepID=UPI001D06B597|nr:uncharacterized protein LOC123306687 [Coccinella septempunctata]